MPDVNGYPTKVELKKLKALADGKDYKAFLEHLRSIWHWPDWGFELTGKRVLHLQLHTGGWSGNESIISTLERTMFWVLFWDKSRRGGHYWFRIPDLKRKSLKGG